MARLSIKLATGTTTVELKPGVTRIGRSPENDLPILHATVSSFHCEMVVTDGSVIVRDLGSTNGTFIDNHKVAEQTLAAGQMLRLGDVELVLDPGPARVAIPTLPAQPTRLAVTLPEGALPCENHPGFPASDRCTKCGRTFCDPCVHVLRRVGGRALRLCPLCSSPVQAIGGPPVGKENFLLALLRRTVRLLTRGFNGTSARRGTARR
ncbi:MAG TPA: FHA domain-containing RING-H2 finger protein [Methylomirabilota bacterium]|nr:FHA domain-containing RING-H2 finger protein [Methylomirabilota bacterium]